MLHIKFADPTSDIAFKKLFANHQHKEVLISFLNAILEREEGHKIVEVEVLDPHNIPLLQELQATVLDVRCTDQDGSHYILEMQKKNRYDFPERCVFYASYVYAQQLTNKKPYKELTPVIFVGILDFNLFNGTHAISHHHIRDSRTYEHTLKHQEYHFVELQKFLKEEDALVTLADKWIYLLKHAAEFNIIPESLSKPEEIATALKLLSTHFWTKNDFEVYFRQMDQYRLMLSDIETERLNLERAREESLAAGRIAGLAEGKAEGLAEGKAEGLAEGKAEGLAEGKVEGLAEGKAEGLVAGRTEAMVQTAQQMLAEGLEKTLIQKITGLSKDEIEKLKK